jgi:hypothetical protein
MRGRWMISWMLATAQVVADMSGSGVRLMRARWSFPFPPGDSSARPTRRIRGGSSRARAWSYCVTARNNSPRRRLGADRGLRHAGQPADHPDGRADALAARPAQGLRSGTGVEPMGDLVKWLNDNSGLIIAAATVAYVVVTALLLFESRRNRIEAHLVVEPEPFGRGIYTVLSIQNLGPTVARDITVEAWETEPSGATVGERLKYAEGNLFPAQRRRMFPDQANPTGARSLEDLAKADITLHAKWSWIDGRRRFLVLPTRHSSKHDWPYDHYRAGLARGHILADRTPEEEPDRLAKAVERMADTLKAIQAKLP